MVAMNGTRGRHRLAVGTPTVPRPASYVGRVGALAVVLGIGGAIAGMPAAVADTADTADTVESAQGEQSASAAADSAPAPASRAAVRGSDAVRGQTPGGAVEDTADEATEIPDEISADATDETVDATDETADDSEPHAPRGAAGRDPVVVPESPALPADSAPADIASPATIVVENPADSAPPVHAFVPAPAAAVPVIAAVPQMRPAFAPAAASVAGPLDWLGGPTGSGAPFAAPLAWVLAAASRRELSAPAPEVAPAAQVTTSEVDPVVLLAARIAGLEILSGLPEPIRSGLGDSAAAWLTRALGPAAATGAAVAIAVLDSAPSAADLFDSLSGAASGFWEEARVVDRVNALLDGLAADLLGSPGLAEAVAQAAGQVAEAADPVAELSAALEFLLGGDAVAAAIEAAVSGAAGAVLDDAAEVLGLLGTASADWIADLTGDAGLAAAVAGDLSRLFSTVLPVAADAAALGDRAADWWVAAQIGERLGALIDRLAGDLLAEPGVAAALAGAAGQIASADDPLSALPPALSSLLRSAALTEAVGATVTAALTGALDFLPLEFATAAGVLAGLAGDFTVSALSGSDIGGAALTLWRALQADPDITAAVGSAMNLALRGVLADPNVGSALTALVTDAGSAALGARAAELVPLVVTVLLDGPAAVDDFAEPVTALLRDWLTGAGLGELAPALATAGFEVLRAGLLGDFSAVPATIAALAADEALLAGLAGVIADSAALGGLPSSVRDALGDAAASWLGSTLGDPDFVAALIPLLGAVDFPTGPEAVAEFLAGLVGSGFDLDAALAGLLGPDLPVALAGFLADAAVLQALDDASAAAAGLLATLAADPAVREFAAEQIAGLVAAVLGGGDSAGDVAAALSDAALDLLSDPAVAEGLGAVAGSLFSGLLGQDGVADALAGVAADLLAAVISGGDPAAALAALWSDPALAQALGATVSAALGAVEEALLGSDAVREALGEAAAALLAGLAENPAIRATIEAELGSLLGVPFEGLLDAVIGVAGPLVTDLLAFPGLGTALTAAANDFTGALLSGQDLTDALQAALAGLQVDTTVRTALDWAVSRLLGLVADSDELREGLGQVASGVVTGLLSGNPLLGPLAGQIAGAATESLLGDESFAALIGDLAGDVLAGTPVNQLLGEVIDAVLRDGALQAALGTAVGQGIGSLFGDNVFGAVVGAVTGAAATFVIGLAAGIARLFNRFGVAAAAASAADRGYFDERPAGYSVTLTLAIGSPA